MRLISWNVNGLRSVWKKGFPDFVRRERPDIVCLQEIKAQDQDVVGLLSELPGYRYYSSPAEKKGYSGVAVLLRQELASPLRSVRTTLGCHPRLARIYAREGRFLVLSFADLEVYNIYFPSGTSGEVRQEFKYAFLETLLRYFRRELRNSRKKILVCGDFNICHKPIDIHHPLEAERLELSGFLPRERAWMDRFTALGFQDCFRLVHGQHRQQFSWWSYRADARRKNLGWRIDYCFASPELVRYVQDSAIFTKVGGADHCPIDVVLALP